MGAHENADVRNKKLDIELTYGEGWYAGYNSLAGTPLPAFYETKPLILLTAWERGYWLGREMKDREL